MEGNKKKVSKVLEATEPGPNRVRSTMRKIKVRLGRKRRNQR